MAGNPFDAVSIRAVGYVLLAVFSFTFLLAWLLLDHVRFAPNAAVKQAATWAPVACSIDDIGTAVSPYGLARGPNSGNAGYAPRVRFNYVVGSETYVGTQFWFATTVFNTRAEAELLIRPFPKGSRATCYYDRAQPTRSVIDRTTLDPRFGWLWFVLFGVVGVAGCAGALFMIVFPERVPR